MILPIRLLESSIGWARYGDLKGEALPVVIDNRRWIEIVPGWSCETLPTKHCWLTVGVMIEFDEPDDEVLFRLRWL